MYKFVCSIKMSLIFKTTFAFENIFYFSVFSQFFMMIMMRNIRIVCNLTASWDLGINNTV